MCHVIGKSKKGETKRTHGFTLALSLNKARTETMRERQKREGYPIRKTENVSLRRPERLVFPLKTVKYAEMTILALGQQSREEEMSLLEALIKTF